MGATGGLRGNWHCSQMTLSYAKRKRKFQKLMFDSLFTAENVENMLGV